MNKTPILKILFFTLLLGILCGCIESNTTNVSGDIDYAESFMDEGYSILDSIDFKNQSESEKKLKMAKSKFSDAITIFSYIKPVKQSDDDTTNSNILICDANLKFIEAHLEYYELFGYLGPYDDYFYYYDYSYGNSKERRYNETMEIISNVEYTLNLAKSDLNDSKKISTDLDNKKIEKTSNYIYELCQRKENAELMINSPDKYDSIYQKFLNSTDMDESKFLVIRSEFNNVTSNLTGIDYEKYPELKSHLNDTVAIGQNYNETMNEYMNNYEILSKADSEFKLAYDLLYHDFPENMDDSYASARNTLKYAKIHFGNAKESYSKLMYDYGSVTYDLGHDGYYASYYYINAINDIIYVIEYTESGDKYLADMYLSCAKSSLSTAESYL